VANASSITADPQTLAINTIKTLAMDAVEKAKSGHPGTPMGLADIAYVMWAMFLRMDPKGPSWAGRDRFVLSAGHACMLQYALLHLFGYDVSLDDLKSFRQWDSKTPGHPEWAHTPGIETTTGPLGQGISNAVGMAIAAKMLSARFDTPDFAPADHRIYVIASDGDLMEGVSAEASSLAGHLGLGNLIAFYDDNHITIEGDTKLAFSEDVGKRYEAYGWHVQRIDGHDHAAIERALRAACDETKRPSLVVARTHIAKDAPTKHDTAEAHGSPLGADEIAATKKVLGWPVEPAFLVPEEVRQHFAAIVAKKQQDVERWKAGFQAWRTKHPDLAKQWDDLHARSVPADLESQLLAALPPATDATRILSNKVLQKAAALVPTLVGGSADLEPSTKTRISSSGDFEAGEFGGRNFHFGIREHGMGSVLNGIAAHGPWIPYGATFLIFSDYMRPPMRLAAIMKIPVIYVFTHDSIFLGEDGPTHQPIEQLAGLRSVPNMVVLRPADGPETALAWAFAARRRNGPTAMALTRQKVAVLERSKPLDAATFGRGGYVLADAPTGKLDVVIVATGSEVGPAVEARALLEKQRVGVRVVSMPSIELFFQQPDDYREAVVPRSAKVVAVEAAAPDSWYRVVGRDGLIIGMRRYGASAPANVLAEKFGFTGPQVAAQISTWLAGGK
jgi:transketolase